MDPMVPRADRPPDIARIRAVIAFGRRARRTFLLEPEGLALLEAAGIATPRWRFVPAPTSRGPAREPAHPRPAPADPTAVEADLGSSDRRDALRAESEKGGTGTPEARRTESPEPLLPLEPDRLGALDQATLDALPGDRVVVKVVAGTLAHKTEVGGVAVVPREMGAVRAAVAAMRERIRTPIDGFLVAEHVAHDATVGGELLLSLRWTEDVGPVVSVGAGGTLTEALAADLRPGRELAIASGTLTPPAMLGTVLARSTAVRLATTPQRGAPARLDPDRLADVVGRLLALGEALVPDELLELEVNPAAVTSGGLVALDVLAMLGDGPRRPPAPRPIHRIARLLEPRSVAIVGVSTGPNPGHVILGNLRREGFPPDRITVVKRGVDELDGCRCVPEVAALPSKVDLFVVAVSAAQAPGVVAEVVERDLAESLIVIPGGLEETAAGVERGARMREAIAAARARPDGGPILNGGNCLGIRSRPGRYDTMFIPPHKLPPGDRPAPVALLTGSGAFAITRLQQLRRLDPRYVITIGNQADLTAGDHLAYLADDPAVRVIGVYVEGFRRLDGAWFLEAAARIAAEGRSVVLYRAGRTAAGARASASHTASISGDAPVSRELARQAGVLVADTPAGFDDLVRLALALDDRPVRGRRLGALSNAGSECVTIADHAGSLELPPFAPATATALAGILAAAGIDAVVDVHNPLDLSPIADAAVYEAAARTILGADEFDLGIVGIVPLTDTLDTLPPGSGHGEDLARPDALAARLIALWRETRRPWVTVVDGGPPYDPFVDRLEEGGIPVFRTADAALRALATFAEARLWVGGRSG